MIIVWCAGFALQDNQQPVGGNVMNFEKPMLNMKLWLIGNIQLMCQAVDS